MITFNYRNNVLLIIFCLAIPTVPSIANPSQTANAIITINSITSNEVDSSTIRQSLKKQIKLNLKQPNKIEEKSQ